MRENPTDTASRRPALSSRALPCLFALLLAVMSGLAQTNDEKYDTLVSQARTLLREEKVAEAATNATEAVKLLPARYDAHAVTALIAIRQGDAAVAKAAVAKAIELAPADKKAPLESLQKKLAELEPPPAKPAVTAEAPKLTGEARRKLDGLLLIIEEADKAKGDERTKLLREFMAKSADFILLAPQQNNIWIARAAVAVELDYHGAGWLAGRWLKEAGLESSDEPAVRKVLAALERKGWLAASRTFRDWGKLILEQAKAAAKNWDAEAMFALGDWLSTGISSLAKNEIEAVIWLRKAGEAGDADAQMKLSLMYSQGRGVDRDMGEAVRWLRKAAAGGIVSAQSGMGFFYQVGIDGVLEKSDAESAKWYRKAAMGGDSSDQRAMEYLYAEGLTVVKDPIEAIKWHRKAAEAGDAVALILLGDLYAEGQGVVKNDGEAVKYFRKAAEAGAVNAMEKAGWMLATSADKTLRDGRASIGFAREAVAMFRIPRFLNTLAAAYAEAGDFDLAIKTQNEAIGLLTDETEKKDYTARLRLYEAKKSYRQ